MVRDNRFGGEGQASVLGSLPHRGAEEGGLPVAIHTFQFVGGSFTSQSHDDGGKVISMTDTGSSQDVIAQDNKCLRSFEVSSALLFVRFAFKEPGGNVIPIVLE